MSSSTFSLIFRKSDTASLRLDLAELRKARNLQNTASHAQRWKDQRYLLSLLLPSATGWIETFVCRVCATNAENMSWVSDQYSPQRTADQPSHADRRVPVAQGIAPTSAPISKQSMSNQEAIAAILWHSSGANSLSFSMWPVVRRPSMQSLLRAARTLETWPIFSLNPRSTVLFDNNETKNVDFSPFLSLWMSRYIE